MSDKHDPIFSFGCIEATKQKYYFKNRSNQVLLLQKYPDIGHSRSVTFNINAGEIS